MDTVKKGRYPTFDKTFEIPRYNFRVQKEFNIEEIILDIKKIIYQKLNLLRLNAFIFSYIFIKV